MSEKLEGGILPQESEKESPSTQGIERAETAIEWAVEMGAMTWTEVEEKLEELALGTDMSELGRFMVTKNRSDIGAFRTSMLLNIGITQPYMHDGSLETLWDVIDHYNKGGEPNLFLDGGMEPLALSDEEIDQLVAFLFALTDDGFADENRRLMGEQRAKAAEKRPFRDDEMANRRKLAFEERIQK